MVPHDVAHECDRAGIIGLPPEGVLTGCESGNAVTREEERDCLLMIGRHAVIILRHAGVNRGKLSPRTRWATWAPHAIANIVQSTPIAIWQIGTVREDACVREHDGGLQIGEPDRGDDALAGAGDSWRVRPGDSIRVQCAIRLGREGAEGTNPRDADQRRERTQERPSATRDQGQERRAEREQREYSERKGARTNTSAPRVHASWAIAKDGPSLVGV
jgi:hypothetical protein